MKRMLWIIIFGMVVLASVIVLTAFTFLKSETNKNDNDAIKSKSTDTAVAFESAEIKTETDSDKEQDLETAPQSEVTVEKIKTITVQGKKITVDFVGRKENNRTGAHASNVYKNNDGATLEYDSVTEELLCMIRNVPFPDQNKEKITSEDAISIANDFIQTNTNLDFVKYTLTGCKYYENTQSYDVNYSWLYSGYTTGDSINISIRENGEIRRFSSNPYAFEGVKMKPVDEQSLLKQLDKLVHKHRENIVSYKVIDQGIGVDSNNELIMCYNVSVAFEQTLVKQGNPGNKKYGSATSIIEEETKVFTEGVGFNIKI